MKFKRVNKDEGAGLYDNDVPHWMLLMGNPTNFVFLELRNL
jgi:hypothetical protein